MRATVWLNLQPPAKLKTNSNSTFQRSFAFAQPAELCVRGGKPSALVLAGFATVWGEAHNFRFPWRVWVPCVAGVFICGALASGARSGKSNSTLQPTAPSLLRYILGLCRAGAELCVRRSINCVVSR